MSEEREDEQDQAHGEKRIEILIERLPVPKTLN